MRRSFLYAIKGFKACAQTERNFRIHLAAAFYVLIASAVSQLNAIEWTAVLICIGAVTGAELFNTAIEKLCDAFSPGWSKTIGVIKDMAAGAVLMFAVMSAAVGVLIFINDEKMTRIAAFAKGHIPLSVLIAVSLPVAVYLVFRRYVNDNKISHDNDCRPAERR